MTGGGTFRAEVGADGVFDRLRRELGGTTGSVSKRIRVMPGRRTGG